jgi:ribokinase
LETPLDATVQILKDFEGLSILNGAPAMNLSKDVLKLPSIFCVNELEAEEMTGIAINEISAAKESIEVLMNKGCKMVIITLGKLGATFCDGSKVFHMPVPTRVTVVDTGENKKM